MCFSAQISFTASGVLLPLGLYSIVKAFKTNRHYILFSFIPLIFSIHQFIEGMIWDKLHHHPFASFYQNVLEFTFIAFFVWPIYIPLSVQQIEPQFQRRQFLQILTLLGFILSIAIFVPIFLDIVPVGLSVVHHSIAYPIDEAPFLQKIQGLSYITIVFLSLFLSSIKEIRYFGGLLLMSFTVSMLLFYFALTSVWCFFAAALSSYIAYILHKLPKQKRKTTLNK